MAALLSGTEGCIRGCSIASTSFGQSPRNLLVGFKPTRECLPARVVAGFQQQFCSQSPTHGGYSRTPVHGPVQARQLAPIRASAALAPEPVEEQRVEDVMTRTPHKVYEDTSVDDALDMMVTYKITGLPVVDQSDTVIGVVSDFDLLSLDNITGKMAATGLFPDPSMEWSTFNEVKKLVLKNAGRLVSDVMTEDPLVVRPETNLEAAARILLQRKVRRLPVVDERGRLIGMFTRGDVIKAAMRHRKRLQ